MPGASEDQPVSPALPVPWPAVRAPSPVTITKVRAIRTAPEGTRLVVVRVDTTEPGLYGLGCATFSQRADAVARAVEAYLAPMAAGRDPGDIEDIWQTCQLSSYWRSGPVLNNALSGLDQALWDIAAKRAGMPLYQLFGGRCRRAADVYVHVKGASFAEVEDLVRARMADGFRYVRCQPSAPPRLDMHQPAWDPDGYARQVPRLFEHLRNGLGEDIGLLHDAHERLPPPAAIQLAKDLEPFRLFYLEDLFAPEDHGYLPALRAQSATPIAVGELCVNQHEYVPFITGRLIDFIRAHVSAIGGLTPARKLAALCEFFGVRTAWHGPDDVSPVGHAAQLHLNLATPNFGIQETHVFDDATRSVFPGLPEIRDGAMWPNDAPGLGIDIDERMAARFPFPHHPLNAGWPTVRRADGTVVRP
ncbi:MAG TPA: enolase C-terminal domain-like protein [Streptosporangiaceae bacterium]